MAFPSPHEFRSRLPSVDDLVERAISEVLGRRGDDPQRIKAEFSSYFVEIDQVQYALSERSREEVWDSLVGDTPVMLRGKYGAVSKLATSFTNSSRTRGGKAFEKILGALLTRLRYPYEAQVVVDGKPDFILPNAQHYHDNPADTIILTCKRTLRERWRQIAIEGRHGLSQFLATVDEGLGPGPLLEMNQNTIRLVVPKSMKERIPVYAAAQNVVTFEDFLNHTLDHAMEGWRRAGIVQ